MPASALEIHPEALLVAEAPERWHPYVHGTRRYVLRDFPYSVVYRASSAVVTIYAFAHAKRRPGYWQGRLP